MLRYTTGAVTVGDIFGRGPTTQDLTNPSMDVDHDGQVDDVAKGQATFPRAVIAILAFFGALIVAKFVFEKIS